jgi:hypothetical protein
VFRDMADVAFDMLIEPGARVSDGRFSTFVFRNATGLALCMTANAWLAVIASTMIKPSSATWLGSSIRTLNCGG